jgi:hypothetical protein
MSENPCTDDLDSNLDSIQFSTPRDFFQIYFNQRTKSAKAVRISSPSIQGHWNHPSPYAPVDEKCLPVPVVDLHGLVPSGMGSSFDSSSTASSCSEADVMDEDVWGRAIPERVKECSAVVYFPFRCINEFEFFSPTLSSIDVDDNPALPLFENPIDAYKCMGIKSLCCIFPSTYPKMRKRALHESSDDWRRVFFGYSESDKYFIKV